MKESAASIASDSGAAQESQYEHTCILVLHIAGGTTTATSFGFRWIQLLNCGFKQTTFVTMSHVLSCS